MVWTAEEITVLLLLLLPDPAAPHYVPSPCYNFTITPKPRPGQSWCEVQRQFTRYTFYTCSSQKVEPISPLGMMSSATASWNQQDEHWKELMEELRKALLDNKENISKAFYPLSLQGSMTCQQESNGHPRAFWEFGFYGQICLSFHSKDRHWTELKLKCRPLKEALDSARDLLLMISAGDCGNCVKESETLDTKDVSLCEDCSPAFLVGHLLFCHSRRDGLHQPQPQAQLGPRPRPTGLSPQSSL